MTIFDPDVSCPKRLALCQSISAPNLGCITSKTKKLQWEGGGGGDITGLARD